MSEKVYDFPQFRKLSNGKSFYRILDERHWDELQLIGEKVLRFQFEAKQYPEIIRIQDMLSLAEGHYLECRKEEFEGIACRALN